VLCVAAAAGHEHGHAKRAHERDGLAVPLHGQVEAPQPVVRERVGACVFGVVACAVCVQSNLSQSTFFRLRFE
jgi:hypothetical protein